jgi:hypothetical protein
MHLSPAAIESVIRLLEPTDAVQIRGNIVETESAAKINSLIRHELIGVSDGIRTRDSRSHSPELYH